MTKKVRIPNKIPISREIGARLRYKFMLRNLRDNCRKDTGVSLAQLYNEILRDEKRKRRKPKGRPGGPLRKTLDETSAS